MLPANFRNSEEKVFTVTKKTQEPLMTDSISVIAKGIYWATLLKTI